MEDSERRRSFPCVVCSKRTKPKDRRWITGIENKAFRKYLLKKLMIRATESDVSWGKCRNVFYKTYRLSQSTPVLTTEIEDSNYQPPEKKQKHAIKSPRTITLPLPSVSGQSHSTCCVCRRRGPKQVIVPAQVRYNILIDNNIIIAAGSRCCPGHIDSKNSVFTPAALEKCNTINRESQFNRTNIVKIIQNIREIALKNKKKRIDFDSVNTMTDSDFFNLMGVDKDTFNDICDHVTNIRDSTNRTQRTCIGILLTKLRTGMSNKVLSTIFNIGISSVKRSISSARKALSAQFTPNYIGFQHIDRQTVISNHTRQLAKTLFGGYHDPAILVVDGTYIYIQKSMQFNFQRRSYSMHKKRPLVKPMMIVTTTGYILSVLGPYFSDFKNNDANILKHAFATNIENLKQWLKDDDVLIVDRGFRDSLELLKELGINTAMPTFLKHGTKQHTVEESNASRLVTKVKWVVESANGRIKSWKLLDNIVPNTQIPYIGDYTRLVCAMSNKYRKPLCTSDINDEAVGLRMLYLMKCTNALQQKVVAEGLNTKKACWKGVDAMQESLEFPRLDEEDLRSITIGVYQLKLAKCYTREHFNDDGEYELLFHSSEPGLIMAKIQSRHVSSKAHKLWVSYTESSVTGWYCQCRAGARVVGCCSHTAAVVWFLGYARYQGVQEFNSSTDWSMYLTDAHDMPQPQLVNDDSDVDETEE